MAAFSGNIHAYMCEARQGCTVVIPFREEMTKRHLKVTGDLGRVVFVVCDAQLLSPVTAPAQ